VERTRAEGVPANVADGFSGAPSAGKYYNAFIKDAYEVNKV
jgi:hypothetical protein